MKEVEKLEKLDDLYDEEEDFEALIASGIIEEGDEVAMETDETLENDQEMHSPTWEESIVKKEPSETDKDPQQVDRAQQQSPVATANATVETEAVHAQQIDAGSPIRDSEPSTPKATSDIDTNIVEATNSTPPVFDEATAIEDHRAIESDEPNTTVERTSTPTTDQSDKRSRKGKRGANEAPQEKRKRKKCSAM